MALKEKIKFKLLVDPDDPETLIPQVPVAPVPSFFTL